MLRIPTNADTVTTIADTVTTIADTVTTKPPKCPRSFEFVSAFRRAPHPRHPAASCESCGTWHRILRLVEAADEERHQSQRCLHVLFERIGVLILEVRREVDTEDRSCIQRNGRIEQSEVQVDA